MTSLALNAYFALTSPEAFGVDYTAKTTPTLRCVCCSLSTSSNPCCQPGRIGVPRRILLRPRGHARRVGGTRGSAAALQSQLFVIHGQGDQAG
jgi:hypothetical protein